MSLRSVRLRLVDSLGLGTWDLAINLTNCRVLVLVEGIRVRRSRVVT